MANLIRSLGYSLGKVHSGLIAYLCDLYREDVREPLESLFGDLGVRVPPNPVPRREWNSVDLAILDGHTGQPRVLVEMKINDHERGASEDSYQTVRYARSWPSCDAYLFVTLGMGEYYHPPRSHRFAWVRIRDFLRALDTVKAPDDIIKQWTEEVRREVGLQEAAFRADRSRLRDFPTGSWNIYFLGQLAEQLAPLLRAQSVEVDATCYAYGTRPDTILNFGGARKPQYMEINYNGKLNLKISLKGSESARRDDVEQALRSCRAVDFPVRPTYHPTGKIGNSKTVASFDVGLVNVGNALRYAQSPEWTRGLLLAILSKFYRARAALDAPNPPIQPTGSAGG